MTTLHDLIQVGALKSALKPVSLDSYPGQIVSHSEFNSMGDAEKLSFKGLVVIDGAQWYATVRGADPTLAKKVYSGDGGLRVGVWNREKKKYFLAEVIDGTLNVIERLTVPENTDNRAEAQPEKSEKENKTMADSKAVDLLDSFGEEALKNIKENAKPAEEPTVAVGDAKEKSKAQENKEKREKEINEIKTKVSEQGLADRTSVVSKNQKYGRLMGFVTKTNDTVKVSKRQVAKMQQGKPVLSSDAPQDVKAEHDAGKKVPAKWYEKKVSACLRNTNPGAIIGVVIATPVGGRFDLNDLSNPNKRFEFDETQMDLKYTYHPKEEAYVVLGAWYDGKILEDDTVIGSKATTIQLVNSVAAASANDASGKPKVRPKLVQNRDARKSLLIPGNYFPAKVYETIAYQNLSAEDAAALNYNFEAMLKNSFSTDDNTDTEGDEVDKSKDTGDTITLDSLEKDYKNGEKKKIEVSNYNDLTSLQNLMIDLIETKGDYDAAQQLKANKTILNPIQDRFKNDCSEIKKMAGMTNFKDPALTSTVGTILAQVLAIKYKGIKLETAISRLQLTMDVYKAVNGKTGKQCYEDAKTYLTEKPIATYISGISKIYGGNEITKSTAKSYADKAIAKGNNKGIFVFTGDVSKGCIALAQDFKQKNVKGFSRSKEFTYGGAGTKYRYIMAEYKENGFYYPKGSKAKSFSINGTKYNFSTGEKVSQNGGTVSGILKALAQPFTPLEVQAAKATKDNTNTTDTSTDGDTTTNGESNTDDDTTSNNDSESNTTVTTTTATTQNPAVESIQAKKYDLDSATYSYEEVTDENIMSQPLLFYGTEYERAVDNTTSAVLRNILKNASALSVIKSKSSRFLYVNCYGDIVTDDNLVILPGASNPLLYNDNENYNPYTAAFMNNYPSIITNSENLQFTSKNDVGKYLAMANTYDEDYTDTDIKAYLVSGDDSVDETSEITLAKLQREFYANNVDSLNILSTGRYAVGSYQNWKNSDLYAWSSIVMKKTPLVDDKIIFPYVPKDDLDGSVGASIASNLYTFYTKDASDTGSTSKLNDNYICHNFIFCNSNGTNDPVGYAKNFQLQYDTYVKNTLERFTTQLIDLSDSLFSKVSKLDGVIGLKNTYTDPLLGNLLGTIRQYWIPFCFIVGLIFLAAFMKMRRDLIESVVMVVVSLAVTYAFVNIVPVYLPLAYNSVINNVSENLTYQILGTSAEINDVEDTHVSSVGDNGDFLNQTTSLTLYKVGTKDFADFANSLNVDQSQLLGGKKYIIDQASGLYAEGDKLKISADVLFDTLPITGSYEDSGEGTYTMKATKTVSNNMDYYAPYYQIVDGFVNKLNALAQIYDIPRKTTTYAQSTVKDSYLVYSFVNSPVFTTPGNYKQGEVEETNLSDADQEEEALNSKTVEEELTKEFGSGTDFLGIGDLVYNLGDSEKKTLWAQTMRKNGYYTADWEPVKDKLNSLVVYVNYQTKKFIYDMSDEVGSMSDDTMIKLISLRALVAFTQQASEYGDWLYPYCINYNEYNLGDIVKCIYTSDYNKYVNLDMDIVNYVGNDLGWFFLILFDASVILLYLIVFILKLLVSVLYVSLAILIIVKLFTQNDLKAPITGYFKCNVIVFALFTALSLCLVGVSKLDGSPIALFLTLLVLCLVAYVLATLLSSLIRGFATLGNETINAKITGLAQHLPFGRNMQQSMQVNTTNVNYGKRNSRTGFNPEERGVFDSYRIDQDVDDIDVGAGSFNPGSFSQGNFSQDDDLIEGIYENATRDNRDHRGGSR